MEKTRLLDQVKSAFDRKRRTEKSVTMTQSQGDAESKKSQNIIYPSIDPAY